MESVLQASIPLCFLRTGRDPMSRPASVGGVSRDDLTNYAHRLVRSEAEMWPINRKCRSVELASPPCKVLIAFDHSLEVLIR